MKGYGRMQTHYFTDNSSLHSNEKTCRYSFMGHIYEFVTDDGVFSKSSIDEGSRVLLEAVSAEDIHGEVLDLGCGYGPIGIIAGTLFPSCHLTMTDINPRAVGLAVRNCAANGVEAKCFVSDGFAGITGMFDHVLTNPPIRAGKSVIYKMFEDAHMHLHDGGSLYAVIRRKQGAESAVKKFTEVFGNCEVILRSRGYWVLKGIRVL